MKNAKPWNTLSPQFFFDGSTFRKWFFDFFLIFNSSGYKKRNKNA